MFRVLSLAAALVLCVHGFTFVQAPAQPANKPFNAQDIMQKTLAAYSAAKTYQANWSYTLEQGDGPAHQIQKMALEIKSKAPNHLFFRLAPASDQKPLAEVSGQGQSLPELRVVIDGKMAWFENSSEKSFYKVPLPKRTAISPLMFIPLIPSLSAVERKDDIQVDGKTVYVLAAGTTDGGVGRMEIEAGTFHIKRILTEALLGLAKSTSSIVVEKETYDADLPENAFSFKASRGEKEIPAPPTAYVMFGPPDKEK